MCAKSETAKMTPSMNVFTPSILSERKLHGLFSLIQNLRGDSVPFTVD